MYFPMLLSDGHPLLNRLESVLVIRWLDVITQIMFGWRCLAQLVLKRMLWLTGSQLFLKGFKYLSSFVVLQQCYKSVLMCKCSWECNLHTRHNECMLENFYCIVYLWIWTPVGIPWLDIENVNQGLNSWRYTQVFTCIGNLSNVIEATNWLKLTLNQNLGLFKNSVLLVMYFCS